MKKQLTDFSLGNILSLLMVLGAIYGSYFKLHESIAISQRDITHLSERVAKLENIETDLKKIESDETTVIANQKILLDRVTTPKEQEKK